MKTVGLKRLTVNLLYYNRKWKDSFETEAKKLKKLFPHIEHIGSTAIRGIKAKPIIDMLAGILSMGKSKDYIKPLNQLGYRLRPQGSPRKHLLFVKGKESNRTHYLHLVKFNGQIWKNDTFFRDYLNKNKKSAKAYEKLKESLAEKFAQDRGSYTKAKKKFIEKIISKQ